MKLNIETYNSNSNSRLAGFLMNSNRYIPSLDQQSLIRQSPANLQCRLPVSMTKILAVSIELILVLKRHDLMFVALKHHEFLAHLTKTKSSSDNFYHTVEASLDLLLYSYH